MVSPSTIILSGPRTEMFSYDQVGSPDTTQDQMFEWVGVPIVNKCIQGYNGTIFAYGQTGSGKTLVQFVNKATDFILDIHRSYLHFTLQIYHARQIFN